MEEMSVVYDGAILVSCSLEDVLALGGGNLIVDYAVAATADIAIVIQLKSVAYSVQRLICQQSYVLPVILQGD